jgi:hypothetical protein
MKVAIIFCTILCITNAQKVNNNNINSAAESELFYQNINATLRSYSQMYNKRLNCIIEKLQRKKVIEKIDKSIYEFVQNGKSLRLVVRNRTELMRQLDPHTDVARFECTIIGFCAIFLICTVLLIVISCVACLHT